MTEKLDQNAELNQEQDLEQNREPTVVPYDEGHARRAEPPRNLAPPRVPAPQVALAKVALTTGSILSEAAIDHLLGLPGVSAPPFVWPGTTPPANGPYLHQAQVRDRLVWKIRDRPSAIEKQHGIARKDRLTTGCEVGDEAGAARFWFVWMGQRRARALGLLLPTQIDVATVLHQFTDQTALDEKEGRLTVSTAESYRRDVGVLNEFFGNLKLSDLNEAVYSAYVDWRVQQRIACQNEDAEEPRYICRNTAITELETLRNAMNRFMRWTHVSFNVRVVIPRVVRVDVIGLERDEAARLLWRCRGRIWNAEKGRWRIQADDAPLFAGTPEGAKRVIDAAFAKGTGRALGRLIRFGLYSGSRHAVLLRTSHVDTRKSPHFDADGRVCHRRGTGVLESTKRTPSFVMPAKLACWAANWRRIDLAKGIARVIHKPDGTPYNTPIGTSTWRSLAREAGVFRPLHAHVMRHTCALWLKREDVSLQQAADFLGMDPRTLVNWYGAWDLEATAVPAEALNGGRRGRRLSRARRR